MVAIIPDLCIKVIANLIAERYTNKKEKQKTVHLTYKPNINDEIEFEENKKLLLINQNDIYIEKLSTIDENNRE